MKPVPRRPKSSSRESRDKNPKHVVGHQSATEGKLREDLLAPESSSIGAGQALAEKEAELREVQRLAGFGSWQLDLPGGIVTWSEELYRQFGLDASLPAPKYEEHKDLLTPASWDLLKKSVQNALDTGQPYEVELEVLRPDGSHAWLLGRGEGVRDTAGHIVRFRGTSQDITARKKGEEALRKSERMFATLFNAVPVGVNLVNLHTSRQMEVNEAILRMIGYSRDEVLGHTAAELGIWENLADRDKLLERQLKGEHVRNAECRFRRKNGEPFMGLFSAELIDLDGEQCAISVIMDVSELRRAEESVRKLTSKLALHFQQTMLGVIEFSADSRVNEWNPAAEAIFGYSRQEAIGRDARDLIVALQDRAELTERIDEIIRSAGHRYSINRNVTKTGEEIICEWFNTPLVQADGTTSGVMSLVRDVTAEKKTQSELAASQATLCSIFQSTDDSIWTVDAKNFALMTFNSAAADGFAKRRGFQLRRGMTPVDMVPADRVVWWNESYRQALTGSFEADYVGVDNVSVFRMSFNPLLRDGRAFGVSVFARNVTKRRQAEEALRISEERYRHLVNSSSDWVWEVDNEGRYTYVSPQCRDILGYEPEELIGKNVLDLMPQEEANESGQIFPTGQISSEQKPVRGVEKKSLHKNGQIVILETNAVPIVDQDGGFRGYRGMDRDITVRKKAEEALREGERRLHSALESGRMYAFEWDMKTDVLVRSPEYAAVLDSPELPQRETGNDFLNRLHPEDRPRYMDVISHLTPARAKYGTEYRKILPGGRVCWIETRGRGFFDAQGNLIRVVGVRTDATARKESEDALRTLSACLINAQEKERTRLARELHDGVSQALAVISIQLTKAANASTEPPISSQLETLYGRLQSVLSDIGHLSHELHPSTLKHLGLSAAIQVLCEEVTQAHGIAVSFRDVEASQPTSNDIALCLYRVAQEALQNVVKHSRSKQASVELRGTGDQISIHITDAGVGFDTESPQAGLGLVSMRERLRLVGGRITITCRPGFGTRIEAYVPLRQPEGKAAA